MKKFLRKNLKYTTLTLLLLVFSLGFFTFQSVTVVHAQGQNNLNNVSAVGTPDPVRPDIVSSAIITVLAWIIYGFAYVAGLLLTFVIWILINIIQYNNFIDVPTVVTGWVIVRDFCNMFFVLILLFISFAIILRIETYVGKRLLPKLIIMAILINFSRTIFGLIIDFSQVIMLTFVAGFSQYGAAELVNMFQINKYLSFADSSTTVENIGTLGTLGALIAGFLALLITLVVMVVFVAIIIMRIVMLWIYTILSPLIFLGRAFPAAERYTEQIWGDFIKSVITGPLLAFFIWLALATAQSSATILKNNNISSAGMTGTLNSLFTATNFQQYIIVIGLLVGGLMVTQQMGGLAGSLAGKGLGAIQKSSRWVGKKAASGAWNKSKSVAKGTWNISKSVAKGVDNKLGGHVSSNLEKVKSKSGAAGGAALGASVGAILGPVGVLAGAGLGALIGGFAGKKFAGSLTQHRQDSRNRRKAAVEKKAGFDASGNETDDTNNMKYKWNDEYSAYVDDNKLYKENGQVVSQQKSGGKYLNQHGGSQNTATNATHEWDDNMQAYVAMENGKKADVLLKDENGVLVNRYGEFEKQGKKYRRRSSDDDKYYEVNSSGQFVDEKGNPTKDKKPKAMARSAFGGYVKFMKDTRFHDGYMASRTRSLGAAEAAEQAQISDMQKEYGHLSGDEAARLMEVEKNDNKRMALAIVAAIKGGFKNAEKVNIAKNILRGNSALLKQFNDEMNKNHMIINNTNKDGKPDEANITKLISSGKAKWSDQDSKEISQNSQIMDLISKQQSGKFQATLESMAKTNNDQKNLTKALLSNINARGFEGDDFKVRKAAAYFSGDFAGSFKDKNNTVRPDKMGEAIKQIAKGDVFGDLTDATLADADFQQQFVQNVTINQLNAATRSTNVDEAMMDKFMDIIDGQGSQDLKDKIKNNNNLKFYAKPTW